MSHTLSSNQRRGITYRQYFKCGNHPLWCLLSGAIQSVTMSNLLPLTGVGLTLAMVELRVMLTWMSSAIENDTPVMDTIIFSCPQCRLPASLCLRSGISPQPQLLLCQHRSRFFTKCVFTCNLHLIFLQHFMLLQMITAAQNLYLPH